MSTDLSRARHRRYNHSPKGLARYKRYAKSPLGANHRDYWQKKRRLNQWLAEHQGAACYPCGY